MGGLFSDDFEMPPDDPKPVYVIPEGYNGEWSFMFYYPLGCKEIAECENDLLVLQKIEEGPGMGLYRAE